MATCPLNHKSLDPSYPGLTQLSEAEEIKLIQQLQCQKPMVLTAHSTFQADVMGTKVWQRNKKAFKGAEKHYLTQHIEQMEVERKMYSL